MGSIPATLVVLLTTKYNLNKNLQLSNRLNNNQINNINLTESYRTDSGVRQIFQKKQPKLLSKVVLNSFNKNTKTLSRKEMHLTNRAKLLLSTLGKKSSYKNTLSFSERYLTIQQVETQIKNRLSRIESSRRVLKNTPINSDRGSEQTHELISF